MDTQLCEVYHAVHPNFGIGEPPVFPDDYEHVATVNGNNLEVAFELTNHIDHDWTTNKGVKAHKQPCRSTSVGDVVVLAEGTVWRCSFHGWEQIDV